MKSYEEVAKDVLRRSKEEIIKREKRRSRLLKAAGASAACFALVGAVGFGTWISSRQGSNIVLNSGTDFTQQILSDSQAASDTEITGASNSEAAVVLNSEAVNKETEPIENQTSTESKIPPHSHDVINSSDTDRSDPVVPPQNGTVYISEELKKVFNEYGDTFEDGCKVRYFVAYDYYKDGKLIVPTEELYYSESDRLNDFLNECEDPIPGNLGFSSYGENWGAKVEYSINGQLYKSQAENYPANEDYGIVIYLDDKYSSAYIVGEADESSSQPVEDDSRLTVTPFSIYNYKTVPYDPETPPENGQVTAAAGFTKAFDHYGQFYEDTNIENLYTLVIEYYSNGERIDPDEALFESEKKRLTELCGDNFIDSNNFIALNEKFDDNGFHYISIDLTKSQIDKITADESFGCVVYLIGDFQHIYGC